MTVIRSTTPAQFLTLVPRLLGYTPTRSLVVIPFTGTRSTGAMRVDLPAHPDQHRHAAHVLAGLLCRIPDADGLVAVIYDTRSSDEHSALMGEIERQAHACGLTVLDRLSVTDDGYGRVGETRQPLTDLTPVTVAGKTPNEADQHSASGLPAPEPDLLAAALRVDIAPVFHDRDAFTAMVERVATGDDLDAYLFAFVMTACERPSHRDILLVGILGGPDQTHRAWDAQAAWENGADYPADIARVMWGEGPRPRVARLCNLDQTLRRVAATADRTLPGALATLGWVAWALGHSTAAADFTAASLTAQPGHGLAEIVDTFVNAGHLPDWAFIKN
ncbi:DUF4192 family protein [Microbacterium sp. 1P10UB]|uniref:DUF4192 family protein n=1 Tax=unclassified Microbacterium TaxID=2609290 RepID=UPI0039A2AAE6